MPMKTDKGLNMLGCFAGERKTSVCHANDGDAVQTAPAAGGSPDGRQSTATPMTAHRRLALRAWHTPQKPGGVLVVAVTANRTRSNRDPYLRPSWRPG